MDIYGIETLLGLPEFHLINSVIRPKCLDWHLERRAVNIVYPRCQACCSRVQDRQPRCVRDLPILQRPVVLWLHLRRFECQACRHRPWETDEYARRKGHRYNTSIVDLDQGRPIATLKR